MNDKNYYLIVVEMKNHKMIVDVIENDCHYLKVRKTNSVNVQNHQTLVVVENIYFLDLVLLNDEIVVVNQQMNLLVVDEYVRLKVMELIVEQREEVVVVVVEKQVMIENEMDDEIDDDWNFQMYALDDIDENVVVFVEKTEEDN
jgi:hypothetical protein